MTIANTETKLVPIESLKPHPDNPRVGNIDVIAESIRKNGFYGSVIVRDGTNVILAGTHRWKAAQAAGMTEIPVTFVKTDAKGAKRILLADNRTSDLGAYDDAALAELLGSLGDIEGTGWDEDGMDNLLAALTELSATESSDAVRQVKSWSDNAESYRSKAVRSIVVDFPLAEYDLLTVKIQRACEANSVTTISELLTVLLQPYGD